MSDWLDTEAPQQQKAGLPALITLPDDYTARLALVESCWKQLTDRQKTFLQALRDCRFNARAAARQLQISRSSHVEWMHLETYATVVRIWRANAAVNALDKDRLLARQDDIVETLLTPKPVLHQGIPVMRDGVILEEVEAGAAARANETLLKAAGVLKDKDVEVNVGVAVQIGPPTLNIQVMPLPPAKKVSEGVVVDAKFTELPKDDGWLDA